MTTAKHTPRSTSFLPTKEQLCKYIREHVGPLHKRDLIRVFRVTGSNRIALKQMLQELEADGMIARPLMGRVYAHAGLLPEVAVVDVYSADKGGKLLARPAVWNESKRLPIITILQATGQPALKVGDRILVRLRATSDHAYEGRPLRRLATASVRMVGVYENLPEGGRLHPADRREKADLIISSGDTLDAPTGALVVAEVVSGQRYDGLRRARVVEWLGDGDDPRAISLIALAQHGIPVTFPPEALAQAAAAGPVALGMREDLRALPLVTIDDEDARDFDDAVWAGSDPSSPSIWHVIVAIADVAWYVRPGDALDQAARMRGNSIYFPDRVVPMLPEVLSSGLCSLKPSNDRPCLSAHLWINRDGQTLRYRFGRGLIRSAARLTYAQVQAACDGVPDETTAPLLESVITPLYGAWQALARWRMSRGTLELNLPERKVILDGTGRVIRIEPRVRLDSHRLIEEFMIAANVTAAEQIEAVRQPCLYRIHDQPVAEKLESLREILSAIGLRLSRGQVLQPRHFNQILSKADETPHASLVNEVVLRSQAQAEYSAANIGHFGLGLPRYAHFTSPIRRYADLLVHRALISGLALGEGGLPPEIALVDVAAHVSLTERRSTAAERDTLNRYATAFLATHVGAIFPGRISGVTRFGLFVTLDGTGAEGLVPVRTLGGDYFTHNENRHCLVGRRTGQVYQLADAVAVVLREADPLTGSLTFLLSSSLSGSGATRKGWGKSYRVLRH